MKSEDERKWFDFHGIPPELAELYRYFDRTVLCYRIIEDFGYGNGYVYTKEEFGRFLNKLSDLIEVGINVVLTAHAQLRKFEQPDELGAYDRWELKLGKKTQSQTSPLVKEWADMLLFANYKTFSVAVGKDGKKHKGQGGNQNNAESL